MCLMHACDWESDLDIILSQKYEFDVEWWLRYNCDLESVVDISMSPKQEFFIDLTLIDSVLFSHNSVSKVDLKLWFEICLTMT